ncbi:MAG TPA: murein transglycosylase A [Sphingomicrobium sp.]|nr:murein transglycosylase A [Sphingomicrobium sp.]
MRLLARAALAASFLLAAACVTKPATPPEGPPPVTRPQGPTPQVPQPPPAPVGRNALETGARLDSPHVLGEEQAARALGAFRASCPAVASRNDASGLTKGADWQAVCRQAASLDPSFAPGFFYYDFDWVKVGDGRAFATGYYEPEIQGSHTPQPGYVPIYGIPSDLVRCTRPDGTTGRGRIDATGTCVPYFSRAEIDQGALAGRGLELGWAKDPVELFFAEIQGSALVRFDDGTTLQIGYAGQNGRDYVAIGRLLRERGILPPGGANMEAIKDWIRANPDQGRELMLENLSYVFFKPIPGNAPLGALNVPITDRTSVAADPNFVPLGAPIFLHDADRKEVDGLWVAQDVGGAIKGPNRFDTYWGAGAEAASTAGGMSANGQALILVPKGTAAHAFAQP